jgi:hypothetical protein
MARRVAGLLAGGIATGLILIAAGIMPAHGAESKPAVAGTFNVQLKVQKNTNPSILNLTNANHNYTFGKGCAVGGACSFSQEMNGGREVPQNAGPGGGAISWHTENLVDCVNTATGAKATVNGGEFILDGRLVPTATTVRDGVTYVTQMRGTLSLQARITAAGRADNCTIPPRSTLVENARATLTATLVPLAAPPSSSSPTPMGQPQATTQAAGTIPAFELPQTNRQDNSAAAVASGTRSSVPGALVTPSEAIRTAGDRLPQVLLLAALLGLLIVFPAQIFNSTYEENHERIDRQLARLRIRRRRAPVIPAQPTTADQLAEPVDAPDPTPPRARRIAVFFACVVVGTLLGGLLDPKFGANTASYALLIGIFASVIVAVLVAALTGRVFRSATHHTPGWYLRAIPAALLIAVGCVVVSRLTHFEPGYLYGVLGGAVFAAALDRKSEGRAEVAVAVTGFVIALLAWIAFDPVARAADGADPGFLLLTADSFLAAMFIGGLEGLLFGLIPLRFLPGSRIKGWSWVVWGVLMAVVLYAFVHVLLLPESGYLGKSTAVSVTVTLALFGAFGVASGLFWLYFRLRPEVEGQQTGQGTGEEAGVETAREAAPTPAGPPDVAPANVPVDAHGNPVTGGAPRVPQPRQSGPPPEQSS